MTDGGVQKMQVVLDTKCLEAGTGGGVEFAAVTAVTHIDLVHIVHQFQGLLLADILIQSAAEVVGDIVLSVRECTGTAETAHNGAALAADTALYLIAVNGTVSLIKRVTRFKNGNLKLGSLSAELIRGKYTAGARTYNDYIVIHIDHPILLIQNYYITLLLIFQAFLR